MPLTEIAVTYGANGLRGPDGLPAYGNVVLQPTQETPAADYTVTTKPITYTLAAGQVVGTFTTNGQAIQAWVYENIRGAPTQPPYVVDIPTSGTLDLSQAARGTGSDLATYLTPAAGQALFQPLPASYATDSWAGRANGAFPSGEQPVHGEPWLITGESGYEIANGALTVPPAANASVYGQLSLGTQNVANMGATFMFGASGSTSAANVTLILPSDASLSLANLAGHLVVTPTNWQYTVRQNNGALTAPASGVSTRAFATPLATDGSTVYSVSISVVGNSAYLVLPDGTTTVVTDPLIGQYTSGNAIWEIFTVATTDHVPSYTRVWATTQLNALVPLTTEQQWVNAVNTLAGQVLDGNHYNVESRAGTTNQTAIGDIGGAGGIIVNGDTTLFRAGPGTWASVNEWLFYGPISHQGASLGFFGAAPAAKPTVAGSKGGNAALASLLSALASLGLVTDTTT